MMTALGKRLDLRLLALFLFVVSVCVFLGVGKSWAISGVGDRPQIFPDTTWGGGDSFTVVQVTGHSVLNAGTKVKAQSTVASIYVPYSQVNQPINLTIVGGCDFSTRDNDSAAGNTLFYIAIDTGQVAFVYSKSAAAGCTASNKDINITFNAIAATNPASFSTRDNGVDYYVYHFVAFGQMSETAAATRGSRYLNAFNIRMNTPNTMIGLAGWSFPCDSGNYPMSCPSPHPSGSGSQVYSSFYGPAGADPYGQYFKVINSCSVTGNISIYDMEANDLNQTGLKMTLYKGGPPPPWGSGVAETLNTYAGPMNVFPRAGFVNWEHFPGVLNDHWGYGGNNDQYMDIPGGDPMFSALGNFDAGVPYYLIIEGISKNNAFQVRADVSTCPTGGGCPGGCPVPVEHQPTGDATGNCSVVSGWISDLDAAGPYRVHLHFKDNPYTNTVETFTNAANEFSVTVPDAYKGFNNGAPMVVWVDALGKNLAGNEADWIGLGARPITLAAGPCTNSSCSLIDPGTGPVPNGATINRSLGDSLAVQYGFRNSAPAGGMNWATVGGNPARQYDAGWDGGWPPPYSTRNDYNGGWGRLDAAPGYMGATIAPGNDARFVWNVGTLTKLGTYTQVFRMVHEGDTWFGGDCTLTIKVGYASITAAGVLSCDLSGMAGFGEIGEPFDGYYIVRYTLNPAISPTYYPTVSASNPTLTVDAPPARLGTPNSFTLAPLAGGDSRRVDFSPPQYALFTFGAHPLSGSIPVTAPDGLGGTTSTTIICNDNKLIGTRPYMKVYGGEVVAGSSFANPCAATADIVGEGRLNALGQWIGAGSQFGAIASGNIQKFATSLLTAPTVPNTLAFANTTSNLSATPILMGGTYGAQFCATERWPDAATLTALPTISQLTAASGGRYVLSGGTLSQTAPLRNSTTIYVNGDVTITSNLLTTSSWASTGDIPSLYIIAKGNIYIDRLVTELNGLFVAEPTAMTPTVTKGRIFTCYNSSGPTDSVFMASQCANRLTIYGALIAAKVNFLRVNGSVTSSVPGETPSSPSASNIAEIIQFTPELLMSKPADGKSNSSDQLDSVISLHPSL